MVAQASARNLARAQALGKFGADGRVVKLGTKSKAAPQPVSRENPAHPVERFVAVALEEVERIAIDTVRAPQA